MSTVIWYRGKLRPIAILFGERDVKSIRLADMRAYIRGLYERDSRYEDRPRKRPIAGGLSVESIRGHIRLLRRFWRWCQREYQMPVNPMDGIKMPPAPKPVPKAISPDNIVALMSTCENDPSPTGRRDHAMLCFMSDTGCRAGGIVALERTSLDLENHRAELMEKGERGRVVAFSEHTAKRIEEWLQVCPPDSKTVFCSMGTNTNGTPMTVNGLYKMLHRRAETANIKGRINPHSFRHSFARRYLLAGGDLSTLSRILGHSTPTITGQVYATFLNEEALKRYEELGMMQRLLRDKR